MTAAKLNQMSAASGQALVYNGSAWAPASVGGGTVTAVNASAPLNSTGGATPTISLTGTVPVANGGTGAATLTGYVIGNGTSALTASNTIPGSAITGTITGNAANVTGTVAVANGGTGATTLTGYVKGAGTSALTASATIPATDISGTIIAAGLSAQYVDWNAATGGASIANKPTIPSGGAPALTLGTANSAGSASTFVRTDATLLAFDSTVPLVAGTAATGTATVAARRDHVHPAQTTITGTAANVTGTVAVANGGTGNTSLTANKVLVGTGTTAVLQPTNLHWDNSTSRLGIGTTNPSYQLHVVGAIATDNSLMTRNSNNVHSFMYVDATNISTYDNDTSALSAGHLFRTWSNTVWVNALRIMPSGVVGIRKDIPSYTLDVNGSVAGTSAYNNTSDRRLKQDIQPITGALDKVLALQGVTFNWNKTVDPSLNLDDRNHLGFIAQDVEPVLPQVVSTASDAMQTKSLAYGDIVPVLAEAIKDLKAENDALKAELADIKKALGL